MACADYSWASNWPTRRLVFAAWLLCVSVSLPAPGAPQADAKVPPDATPPAAQDRPTTPSTPPVPGAPAMPPGPEVTKIEPPRVRPGMAIDLKITGKNFLQGAKVSFANPGIRVLGITSPSSTELTVYIKAAWDAAPGVASLFVVNPDDNEVEAPFEVTAKLAGKPSPPPAPAPAAVPASADIQRYAAFHLLGSPTEVFESHGRIKGFLVVSSETIQYQEGGKTLLNISKSDVKEIKVSSYANAIFHITLTSGKTYYFAPGSGRPSDARNLVASLRAALPHDAATREQVVKNTSGAR